MMSIFERLFTKSSSRKTTPVRKRQLRLETLESRELLSVNPALVSEVQAAYTDLNLAGNYNVIEITADRLSADSLRAAIAEAGNTPANDLIVLRTTAAQNKITLSGMQLGIAIDTATKGSVTIVSIGNSALTIDANQQTRVFDIFGSTVGLAGLTITNGKATNGGGINIYSSNVTIVKSTISNNSAEMAGGSQGGGLSARDSNIVLNQVDFIENLSTANTNGYGDGGGLYLYESTATVTNSTFKGNSAWGAWGAQGGGCYTWDTDATFANCVFVGNDAVYGGGTVAADNKISTGGGMSQAGGTVTLTNVTIAGNRATNYGAGYYVDGRNGATAATTYIRNSIVALNTGASEQYHTSQGGKTYENNNLKTDPKFVQNPGSIGSKNYGNLQLQSGSSAVNKGNNSYVSNVSTDVLGNARIANGTVDIGAYEYGSTPVIQKPATPTNLASPSQTSNSISLSWSVPSGAAGYDLQMKTGSGAWSDVPSNYISGTTATVTGLAAQTSYSFQIRAKNSAGTSAWSTTPLTVSTKAVPVVAPDAPTVTKSLDNGKPKLSWNAVTGAVTYRVYRLNADGKGWTNISGNAFKATTFTDTSVPAGVHTYAVRAFAADGATGSDFVSAKYATIAVTPDAPTVTKILENGKPKLTWNAVTGAVAYRVYRLNADGLGWTNISGNNFKLTTFTDTGLSAAGVYTYAVRAFLNDGVTGSAFVNTKYATIGVTPDAPTVTKTLDNGKPKLTWNAVTGAVAYRVYRLNDAGNGWTNVSGNALKAVTFTDTTAQAGKTYTYSVQAFLNDGVTGSGFVGARYVTVTV